MGVKFTMPKSVPVSLVNLSCGGQIAEQLNIENLYHIVQRVKWVQIGTTQFKVDDSIILCSLNGGRPSQFGMVVDIITCQGQLRLICKLFRTKFFNKHLQAFRITNRESVCHLAISPLELPNFKVYSAHDPSFIRPIGTDFYVTSKTEISQLV